MITGKELQGALLRRGISPLEFSRATMKQKKTITGWLRNGVPIKHETEVKGWLRKTEIDTGGVQLDAFPETVKDLL